MSLDEDQDHEEDSTDTKICASRRLLRRAHARINRRDHFPDEPDEHQDEDDSSLDEPDEEEVDEVGYFLVFLKLVFFAVHSGK